jgi:membrane protein YqaA with SNARE-associated domain
MSLLPILLDPVAFIACLLVGAAIGAAQGYWVAYFAAPNFHVAEQEFGINRRQQLWSERSLRSFLNFAGYQFRAW